MGAVQSQRGGREARREEEEERRDGPRRALVSPRPRAELVSATVLPFSSWASDMVEWSGLVGVGVGEERGRAWEEEEDGRAAVAFVRGDNGALARSLSSFNLIPARPPARPRPPSWRGQSRTSSSSPLSWPSPSSSPSSSSTTSPTSCSPQLASASRSPTWPAPPCPSSLKPPTSTSSPGTSATLWPPSTPRPRPETGSSQSATRQEVRSCSTLSLCAQEAPFLT